MKKIKYSLITILLLSFPLINVLADSTTVNDERKVLYIAGIVLLVIRIAVPILLIVISSFDLIKAMTQNNDTEIKKVINSIIPKVISAIIIFLLPTILSLILKLVNQEGVLNGNANCLFRPSSCDVQLWDD